MSAAQTRTREQVSHEVDTVEIQEVQCAVCEQWYQEESDEMVPVAIGVDTDDTSGLQAGQEAVLCRGCSESLFGYDGDAGTIAGLRAELRRWTPGDVKSAVSGIAGVLVPIGILVVVGRWTIGLGNQLSEAFAAEASAGASQAAASTLETAVSFIPILVALMILTSVVSTVFGGRM